MYGFRVTKYDPSQRDARGAFLEPDGTSHSDIGKVFGGKKLEIDEYLRVESAYVAAARAFFQEAGCPALAVVDLESNDVQPSTVALGLANLVDPPVQEGERVGDAQLERLCRLNLRELVWCKLEAESGALCVHFGQDFYMYIGTKAPSEDVVRRVAASGLFVEPMRSPYLDDEEPASSGAKSSKPNGTCPRNGARARVRAISCSCSRAKSSATTSSASGCSRSATWPRSSNRSGTRSSRRTSTCHAATGGPTFTIAGTVFPTLHEPDSCNGVPGGVTVVIVDAAGKSHSMPVNAAGNFTRIMGIPMPYKAMVVNGMKVREMKTSQTDADCNGCHSEQGNRTPGRVMAP